MHTRETQRRVALEALMTVRAQQRLRNAEAMGDLARAREDATWQGPGRELRTAPLTDQRWSAIVVCLNIWQDTPALNQTMRTWAEHVDALVVADGPYQGAGTGESTDGLRRAIGRFEVPTHYVPLPGPAWPDQRVKRTALLQEASRRYPGALLVVLDADETVTGAECLRSAPEGDVLWVDVTSPLYKRPYSQPRGIRAQSGLRYDGRHHWLYAGDRLLATHQYGGTGVEHRRLAMRLHNHRGLGQSPERQATKRLIRRLAYREELPASTPHGLKSDRAVGARESLRILQTTTYDAGMVGFRLHTAINTTTPHTSAFGAYGERRAFGAPLQYDLNHPDQLMHAAVLAESADVLHCHLDYAPMRLVTQRDHPRVVIHHHGSMYRKNAALMNAVDANHASLRLVSNLELTQYGDGLHYLPNPMPVARYRRLRQQVNRPHGTFRVAHSPSRRDYKGTDAFLRVCERLRAKGVPVEPVLIEKQRHAESLRLKATCDAAFDSFWLGLQCSGLEAAAMGLPVIAGDHFVAGKYRAWLGEVPYTFADTEQELEDALARLVTDADFRASEAARVAGYTEAHHDDAAVALRYLDLLDEAFQWRTELRIAA